MSETSYIEFAEPVPFGRYVKLSWHCRQQPEDKGFVLIDQSRAHEFFIVRDMDDNEIAAADPWRIQRYLYRGIVPRIEALLAGYLRVTGAAVDVGAGDRVINFGANIGEVALGLSTMGASVFAIEPDPRAYRSLQINAFGRDIKTICAAAWHANDLIKLYQATRLADSSVIDPSTGPAIETLAYTLDTIAETNRIGEIALILGDAEGAEPEVLQGATETLKRTRHVSIRVGPERHGRSSAPLVRQILEAAGFEILAEANETIVARNGAMA